jgi:hypothetical protein
MRVVKMTLKLWLKSAPLLAALLICPIFVIRAQPYSDRAGSALLLADCPAPCFMGIRPGSTSLDAALYKLSSHSWSASRSEDFPAQVRHAVMDNAVLPRTIMTWRWSAALPAWIDDTHPGSVMVEDRAILDITFDTDLLLGEIFLAFGAPDQSLYFLSSNHHLGYIGWYADLGMVVSAEGFCPAWHVYHFPARISFRDPSRGFPEVAASPSTC